MANYHKHHKIPRHQGGSDDPENLQLLTVEEHAEVHRKLYEEFGRWQDNVAWKALSGQISHYEATIEAIKRTQTGRKHSPEEIAKRRSKQIGQKRSDATKEKQRLAALNKTHSEATKEKIGAFHKGKILSKTHRLAISSANKGRPKSEEQRKKMSEAAKRRWAVKAGG